MTDTPLELVAFLLIVGMGTITFMATAEQTAIGILIAGGKTILFTAIMALVALGLLFTRRKVAKRRACQ